MCYLLDCIIWLYLFMLVSYSNMKIKISACKPKKCGCNPFHYFFMYFLYLCLLC